jgi:hypothetical protein
MPARKPRRNPAAEPRQPELFGAVVLRSIEMPVPRRRRAAAGDEAPADKKWKMPEQEGSTVAEVRLRWRKRLTPAQVARVEAELGALPRLLEKLGFGPVVVERAFVRRRRNAD